MFRMAVKIIGEGLTPKSPPRICPYGYGR